MHFKDDPISDMHAKYYIIILCLKHFPGPTKFGPVFWSRLFRRGPVEYNYPHNGPKRTPQNSSRNGLFFSHFPHIFLIGHIYELHAILHFKLLCM